MPQKPDKDWGLKLKEIKLCVNKLGNLTLVHKKINSIIGNKVIREKISELATSNFDMTIKLVEYLRENNFKWDEQEINKRHDELAKIAYDPAWKIE